MTYFKNDIIKNKNFSDEAIFCYLALRSMDTQIHLVCASPDILWNFMVREDIPISNHLSNRILDGLYELQDRGLISLNPCGKNHIHLVKTDKLYFDANCNYFNSIREDEIRVLLKVGAEGNNKFGLLRYFTCILSTFSSRIYLDVDGQNKNYVVSNIPLNLVAKLTGLSHNTIYKYNKLLKEMELLYIANTRFASCNYYCRYENKDALNSHLSEMSS